MSYQTLLTSLKNGILTVTINRPDKLNAINRTVMEELKLVVDEIYNNPDIRSAIITGAGPKAFIAGADITEFMGLSKEEGMAIAKKGHDIFFAIERSPKPIVAAVNGFALGGGCELALSCHFIIASENAKFGQPEVNLGLIPGYGGTQRLVQVAGKGRALELLMTGRTFSAQEAHSIGVANEVVPQEKLIERVTEILTLINSKAPVAIAKVVDCVSRFDHTEAGYENEVKQFGECFATDDMKEGVTAFLEKRKAEFKGK